ncbi:efflux RND transporter periplasmic adaptor subunit [Geobacter sp. SVR]|uniref:efflux RND transporter periplasmic adaptor subunit n=1 Tax=Geobacter sp. SVR TaxID=2495594 RepID=UPI001AFA2E20|nr:efflux RND transporter periplasmic adaptor subunit [Geobacter sp. SVR]BCS55078.1 MexE family multidrug efflux RND transporter periplasmic adaptor subunit [Geobacter sp. SVR]
MKEAAAVAVFLLSFFCCAGCKREKPQPPLPPKVSVSQPLQRKVTYYLELTGNTQAINTVQLVARVQGYLDKVFFHDGQMVKKGQLLFLIQQNTYQDALRQAEGQVLTQQAQLKYAQSQFLRYSNLLTANAAAQSDVDNWQYQRDSAEANLKTASANAATAKLNLGYTRVVSPFTGRIDRRLQDPGNVVGSSSSNTNLAQISQVDPIYVYFNVSDSDLARLTKSADWKPGKGDVGKWPVSAGMTGEEGYPHSGRLDFASISVTPTTGTLLMRGTFPNAAGKIMPGLYARVRVPVETRMAQLVPATAVGSDQQGSYVLVVNAQNTVERRTVKTGPLEEDSLRVIEEGLSGNERIVVSALLKAHPGSRVTPEQENPAPKGVR